MTPEGRVKRDVSRLLRSYGDAIYYEMPVPTGFGKSGLDYHGCIRGQYFAIETKRPGGKPTARQIATMDSVQRAGGRVFLIDSADSTAFQKLKEWLDSCVS